MPVAQNRYYNDPTIGQAFSNLAGMFAPPSGGDLAGYATAAAKKAEAARLAQLFDYAKAPDFNQTQFDRMGVAVGNYAPTGSYYAVDQNNATTRRGQDIDAETSRLNNANTVRGSTLSSLFQPLNQGQLRPEVPEDIASTVGLPAMSAAEGLPKPLSETEWKATQGQRLFEDGKLSDDALKSAIFGGNYGDTVLLGRDKTGNAVPLRAAPNGSLAVAPLPEGIAFDPGGMAGARTASTVDAKSAAAARARLPAAEQATDLALKAIDLVANDEAGLNEQFGQWGALPRNMWVQGGSAMGNWLANFEQARGQAFLQAREMLKGGGQITDFEGRRAEAAYSRMEAAARSGDKQTFLAAATDFRGAVQMGLDKLREAAGGAYSENGSAMQPDPDPATPQTQADFDALPVGAVYRDPDDGQLYRKN